MDKVKEFLIVTPPIRDSRVLEYYKLFNNYVKQYGLEVTKENIKEYLSKCHIEPLSLCEKHFERFKKFIEDNITINLEENMQFIKDTFNKKEVVSYEDLMGRIVIEALLFKGVKLENIVNLKIDDIKKDNYDSLKYINNEKFKERTQQGNVFNTYDGFRYTFVTMSQIRKLFYKYLDNNVTVSLAMLEKYYILNNK